MMLSNNEQMEQFLSKCYASIEAERVQHALQLQVNKLDPRLYMEFIRYILTAMPAMPQDNDRFWPSVMVNHITMTMEFLYRNDISYTEDDIKYILSILNTRLIRRYIIIDHMHAAHDHFASYLLPILGNVLTFLKKETLLEAYRPELEQIYHNASIWGNYEPYDMSYRLRWEMDALLFGESTSNLAALVKRYGREEQPPLAEQGEKLVRVYHEELGNTILERSWHPTCHHPCFLLLTNQIVEPLQIAFVRALLRSDIRLTQDWPLFRALMTREHAYTPAAIHEILSRLNVNSELHGTAFLEYCELKPSLLQLFIRVEREHANLDRRQMEEDVNNMLRLLSKIVLLKEQEMTQRPEWPYRHIFLITLSDLLLYIKQEDLLATCHAELEQLYRVVHIWDNYKPAEEAHRLHSEIDELLFGENTSNLAAVIKRFERETETPLMGQANELLRAYYQEMQHISDPSEQHPAIIALSQLASPVQVALIKALLSHLQKNEEPKKSAYVLVKVLLQKEQTYTPVDMRTILQLLNANFTVHGTVFLGGGYRGLSPELLQTFGRRLQEHASIDDCRPELEAMYTCFSTRAGYGPDSYEHKMRLAVRELLFPAQERELTTLLRNYKNKTTRLDEKAAEAILAALHLELAGIDLRKSTGASPWRSSWELNFIALGDKSTSFENNVLSKQLAKTFAGPARATLVLHALQEAAHLWQQVLEYTPPPTSDVLIELAYIRQDVQLAVTLSQDALYTPADVKGVLGYLLQLFDAFNTRLSYMQRLNTVCILAIVSSCKPFLVQAETFALCETEMKQLYAALPEIGTQSLLMDHQYWLILTDLMTGYQQKFQYPLLPDVWGKLIIEELAAMTEDERQPWLTLINHCNHISGSIPSPHWREEASQLVSQLGQEKFKLKIQHWLGLFGRLREQFRARGRYVLMEGRLDEISTTILQGLIWCCAENNDHALCALLAQTALEGYHRQFFGGPLAPKVGNACVTVLGTMSDLYAISQLDRVRYQIKQASYLQHIQTTLEEVAHREQVSLPDLEELVVFDFDLHNGQFRQTFGAYTAQIQVTAQGATLQWYAQDNQLLKRMPVEIKRNHADEWTAFEQYHKNLEKVFVVQRRQIERSPLNKRTWSASIWIERYLQHPLLSIIVRNLIWQIRIKEISEQVIWYQGHFINSAEQPVEIPENAEIQLWHPLMSSAQEVQHWRLWLEQQRIVQPFKQAHRETYRLEEIEQGETRTSLRYAGHYLRQYPFSMLAKARGWQYTFVDKDLETWAILHLPHWKCRAEFEVKVELSRDIIHSPSDEYEEILTGELGFLVENEASGEKSEELLLEQVPALILSEVIRDLDLFVSTTSVAIDMQSDYNADAEGTPLVRYIRSYGFGELSSSANERKEFLQRLIPSLEVAERCSFQGHFLQVRGDLHVYKIHLGSGNVVVEPDNRHIPMQPFTYFYTDNQKYFLPFEGDFTLTNILSKVFLLADDTAPKLKAYVESRLM